MKKFTALLLWGVILSASVYGQDLVYKPKNPAFGGDTFNYNWLLSSAQSQDLTVDTRPKNTFGTSNNPLEDFKQSLNRQLLSQLSREIVATQFGENGLQQGSYAIGDYQIDVTPGAEGIIITILDSALGEQTQVIIPYY